MKESITAGEHEKTIFLNLIELRFNEFWHHALHEMPDKKTEEDLNVWLEATKRRVINVFSGWYRAMIAGKDIPKEVVIPHPKDDRVYSKFGAVFANRKCEVCGDQRVLNIAHIIPRAGEGPDEAWNLMRLCANHHYLFDNMKLTQDEWDCIDWSSKDQRARDYIESHQLRAQRRYWQKFK